MPPHGISPALLVLPLVLLRLAGGSGDSEGEPGGRMPSEVRTFQTVHESRWIGNAVCYGPHRDGQGPGGPTPTTVQIQEDLRIMAPHWSLLRLYGSSEFGREVLEAVRAESLDVKVMLGVWVAAEDRRLGPGAMPEKDPEAAAANRREVDAAIALAAEYPDVVLAICVGNETQVFWSPHPAPLDLLVAHIRRVRAAVTVPVTTADDFRYWIEPESRALAREIDFLTLHAHPLWNGRQLEDALPWLREQVAAVQAVHPERQWVVGETGWATAAAGEGEQARLIRGTPGETEQAVFYEAVRAWASAESVATFFFEAFDENWKGSEHPSEVEKHWGLFRADRTPKAAVRSNGSPPDR